MAVSKSRLPPLRWGNDRSNLSIIKTTTFFGLLDYFV